MSNLEPPSPEKGQGVVSLKKAVLSGLALTLTGVGSSVVCYEIGKSQVQTRASQAEQQIRTTARRALDPHFSPNGDCTDAILRVIREAKQSILVESYSFTSQQIAEALIDAVSDPQREVDVQILMDTQEAFNRHSKAPLLSTRCPIFLVGNWEPVMGFQHNKVMIIDDEIVVTGSFNFSGRAETENAENLLIITDVALAREYKLDWNKHRGYWKSYKDLKTAKTIGPLTPESAAQYAETGKICMVDMQVANVSPVIKERIFLNYKEDYKDPANFVFVIESWAKPNEFPSMGAYRLHLQRTLEGKKVRTTGAVERYESRKQIKIFDQRELQVLD